MSFARTRIAGGLLLLFALLSACQYQQEPSPPAAGAAAPAWPGFDYPAAARAGETVYRLDPARSRIDVRVGRAGPLARFGHEHVVEVSAPEGWLLVAQAPDRSHANLRFPVDKLEIDAPEARRRYGLDPDVSAEDIEGTRKNLLHAVLDPARWPYVTVTFTEFAREQDQASTKTTIEINGGRFEGRLPFEWSDDPDGLSLHGSLVLNHADLGLEPFSALGGGLRVAEPLEIHFDLRAGSPTGGADPQ